MGIKKRIFIGDVTELTCLKCKVTKKIDMFKKREDCRIGYASVCIQCMQEWTNKYYREKYKKDEEYRKKYLGKKAKWRKENKYNYHQPQTLQRRAYDKIQNSLSYGRIIKPKNCYCCEEIKPLHAHHYDYDKPLDVFWVCVSCHKFVHRVTKDFKKL
jgi:hypothetical protein